MSSRSTAADDRVRRFEIEEVAGDDGGDRLSTILEAVVRGR